MTQLLLRAFNPLFFILVVSLGIAVQTSFFTYYPLVFLQPDVVLLAVIWCALRREFIEGGILTLLFANMAEIHSSVPQGVFLCNYMAVYLLIRSFSRYFVFTEISSFVGLTLFISIVWKLTGLLILHLLGEGADQWRHTLALLLPGAVMESAVGTWIYRLFDRFDWKTFKNPRARQGTEEELFTNDGSL